jgi:Asp-tRNA(Asn)/Glu-tRNA(Gln) amidotransferase A subunit family amidase
MLVAPAPLAETAAALRSGQIDLLDHINEICDRIDINEPFICALLPEPDRRERLLHEAEALQKRFPDPRARPSLYGILLGIKDLFNADGFLTRAGSQLPPELFAGPEATAVTLLRNAGALIMGKTLSPEFAWGEPVATRNPHNPDYSPGGSSSGSAAAVAAGFCPLALGTQTFGSITRPAAYCGIVGFKPTYGRVSTAGMVSSAPSFDTAGFFTQDTAGAALVASLLCKNWQPTPLKALPVLGVPEGPYLSQTSPEALTAFEAQLAQLERVGYSVHYVPALSDVEEIRRRHMLIAFAEMAQTHAEWFSRYESLYRPRFSAAVRDGQKAGAEELRIARARQAKLREDLEGLMVQHGIDLWISPAGIGPAPEGIASTGNPILNIPWTQAGMPVISLPAGAAANGLPLGLQVAGATMADELLISSIEQLAESLAKVQSPQESGKPESTLSNRNEHP